MAAGSVNILVGCERCGCADEYGRDCKHGLMTPVLVLMNGGRCPFYREKDNRQLQMQIEAIKGNRKYEAE